MTQTTASASEALPRYPRGPLFQELWRRACTAHKSELWGRGPRAAKLAAVHPAIVTAISTPLVFVTLYLLTFISGLQDCLFLSTWS
eukprot:5121388-Amphidinium_carterae.1